MERFQGTIIPVCLSVNSMRSYKKRVFSELKRGEKKE